MTVGAAGPGAVVPDAARVLAGGAAGALGRVLVVEAVPADDAWTTLAVNLLGAFLLGVLVAAVPGGRPSRVLIGTGLLGGFTTFSALAVQVATASVGVALVLGAASLAGGLAAAWAGLVLGGRGRR